MHFLLSLLGNKRELKLDLSLKKNREVWNFSPEIFNLHTIAKIFYILLKYLAGACLPSLEARQVVILNVEFSTEF